MGFEEFVDVILLETVLEEDVVVDAGYEVAFCQRKPPVLPPELEAE